ncbi:hypothetical protein ACWIGI_16815 [Nocardia sp. NPDC055321]
MTDIVDQPTRRQAAGDALTHRVTVYVGTPGAAAELVMEYAATRVEAYEYIVTAVHSGMLVTVDGKVRPGLRRLPSPRQCF